ncbi:MAG TPA: flagellar hook-associated protein FlgK [Bryobacteraceae bacterium]|nr:flagellar hook-associated protein FlgK [Bryobacteraceae bacterium]
MGTLNASLAGAASALDALQYALSVSQNNIDNASTPGYARQTASLIADPFDPAAGLSGGVAQGPVMDSRDLLAEREVWQQAGAQGAATAQNQALALVQNALPTSSGNGIPAALTSFFNAVSAWSAAPGDGSTEQTVMDAASTLAHSFNTTAAAVSTVSQAVTQSIGDTVGQINSLTTQLANLNAAVERGGQHDAGLSGQVYSTLENLSGLVNIQVLPQQDGTVNVTLSGGDALVLGTQQYGLSTGSVAAAGNPPIDPQAPPHTAIYGADGADVTTQLSSGTLYGQLQVGNVTIPALTGDAGQPGALNQLATSLASTVNGIVSQGFVSPGNPAAGGLFVTDGAHPTSAAATFAVDSNMTAAGLPAIDQNNVPNGVPLALNSLAGAPQGSLGNASYTAFYGNAAAELGTQLNLAQSGQTLATQSLAQAQSMRQTAEGVDLNAEAVNVMQLQQGYEAAAKLVNTLNTLTQAVINMIP